MDFGVVGLMATGFGLGLRHGIDWDHIAAITDIAGTPPGGASTPVIISDGSGAVRVPAAGEALRFSRSESWSRFFRATQYALGHAIVVVGIGLVAIWAQAILPSWIDAVMERVVGVTLILLGGWIFYQLWRHGRDFQLRSRWMLLFALVRQGWRWTRARASGTVDHPYSHGHSRDFSTRAAFGIGMIHGVGAETGTQALLIAGAAGATTNWSGSAMLLAFVLGLVCSNSAIAAATAFGFVSAGARRQLYLAVGVFAGAFSLVTGSLFLFGAGGFLPDLGNLLGVN